MLHPASDKSMNKFLKVLTGYKTYLVKCFKTPECV